MVRFYFNLLYLNEPWKHFKKFINIYLCFLVNEYTDIFTYKPSYSVLITSSFEKWAILLVYCKLRATRYQSYRYKRRRAETFLKDFDLKQNPCEYVL